VTTICPHGWLLPEVETNCLDEHEVVLRCAREDSVSVRFAERHSATERLDGRLFFLVQARAPRLDATLEGVTNYVVGRGLPRFLERLDFRGWEGEQRWANADRDLRVSARYESGGYIELTWTLKPWRGRYGGWSATVATWLEAGEAKDGFAANLWQFLTADGYPVEYYESDEYFG
jgi:hypothetical protein